jgi:chromate transporter
MKKYFDLILSFLKIGAFTFGGGYAMITLLENEFASEKKWIEKDEFLDVVAIAESTPGPIAINLATYVGYKRRGFFGSLAATAGVVLPSLIVIYCISLFLDAFMANKYVAYAFVGIKCAVAFLILSAGADMLRKMKKTPLNIISFCAVFAVMIVLELTGASFSSVFLILAGGVVGVVAASLARRGGEK